MITIQQERFSRPTGTLASLFQLAKRSLWHLAMPIRASTAVAILSALTLVMVACTGTGGNDLSDSAWDLASLSGGGLIPDTAITIEFTEEEMSGSAGCNHYGGSYQVSGSNLTINGIFATEMACLEPQGILEQEGAYLAALNRAGSYRYTGDQLQILDAAGAQLLVFVAPNGDTQIDAPPGPPEAPVTVVNQNVEATPEPDATPTPEVVVETPLPPAVPPSGFTRYEDAVAGVALFLPESWIVSFEDPGRGAILQSYPDDKYVGGEGFQPGDTKCDLNIRPPGTSAADLIQQWKSNPDTTIISEQEILLESGMSGTRLEVENRGRSLSMFIEVHERAVVLTCFGEFAPFDAIAGSLHESETPGSTAQPSLDSSGLQRYRDSAIGVSVDMPASWVVTGIVPGQRAVLQSYPEDKYVGGEAFQPGDTKCDLIIPAPGITAADFVQTMTDDTAIAILSEAEIILDSGEPGIEMEVESMGLSRMLITELRGQVVVLNCFGELAPFAELAVTLRADG